MYLDGELDAGAELIAAHLEECRRCGLEESVYADIKASLARQPAEVDPAAIERLRRFSTDLANDPPAGAEPR